MHSKLTNDILLYISNRYCSTSKSSHICLCYGIIEQLAILGIIYEQ